MSMSYEYEPIKDLEKEIEYVRWTHEKETRTHEKAVIGTQLEKLKTRLRKFKQAAKADEYEAKAEAFDRIVNQRNQAGTAMYDKDDDVVDSVIDRAFWNIDEIIVEYESGEDGMR